MRPRKSKSRGSSRATAVVVIGNLSERRNLLGALGNHE
jgi:hypothetical protein